MNLANFITLLRLLLIPVLVYLLAVKGDCNLLAGFVFIFSAATDFLDGYVARKLDIVTKLGRILDPLADKLTLISIYLILGIKGFIPLTVGLIIVGREIAVFAATTIFFFKGTDLVFPNKLGKFAACLLYIGAAINIFNLQPFGLIIALVAIPFSVGSALVYLKYTFEYLADKK